MSKNLRCIAFDCFGTLFDMSSVPREEIRDYVNHVKANDFSPYKFPESWWNLKLHPDVAGGFSLLQKKYKCVALSNGSKDLIEHVAQNGGVKFDHVVDLVAHRIYKPYSLAYLLIYKDLNILPAETLMVTANPTFGDVEGAASVGMRSQVIKHDGCPADVIELAHKLGIN